MMNVVYVHAYRTRFLCVWLIFSSACLADQHRDIVVNAHHAHEMASRLSFLLGERGTSHRLPSLTLVINELNRQLRGVVKTQPKVYEPLHPEWEPVLQQVKWCVDKFSDAINSAGCFSFHRWRRICVALPCFKPRADGGVNSAPFDYVNAYKNFNYPNFTHVMWEELVGKQGQLSPFLQSLDGWQPAQLFEPSQSKASQQPMPDIFRPFVQKKILDKTTYVLCCSDIHGDIHSLNAYLGYLYDSLVVNDMLRITDPNYLLVFHGDYVDGGWYGMEVLHLLMWLKIYNVDQVIVLRGNHEDAELNKKPGQFYTFANELHDRNIHLSLDRIKWVYNLMPVAAYIGIKNPKTDEYEYSLHTHAYIEPGFNPLYLLNEPTATYAFVPTHMDRGMVLKHVYEKGSVGDQEWDALKQYQRFQDVYIEPVQGTVQNLESYENSVQKLYFCTGDIAVGKESLLSARFIQAYGENVTEAFLRHFNVQSELHRIKILVRGHQHSPLNYGSDQYTDLILNMSHAPDQGIGKYWNFEQATQLSQNRGKRKGLWDGLVITLWSSPCNMFSYIPMPAKAPTQTTPGTQAPLPTAPVYAKNWKPQSVACLRMSPGFENWMLAVWNFDHQGKFLTTE